MGIDPDGYQYCFAKQRSHVLDGPRCMGGGSTSGGWGSPTEIENTYSKVFDTVSLYLETFIENIVFRSLVSNKSFDLSVFEFGLGSSSELEGFVCSVNECNTTSIDVMNHIGPIYTIYNDTNNGFESTSGLSLGPAYISINQNGEVNYGASIGFSFGLISGYNHKLIFSTSDFLEDFKNGFQEIWRN